jgi:C_GCAxxG_C_C family probable redox protein
MGRQGLTCGALTGAYLVLGLKAGAELPNRDEAKEQAYGLVQEFSRRFRERHKSMDCSDLLGFDISTEQGRANASERGLFETLCPKLVRSAAEIMEEML